MDLSDDANPQPVRLPSSRLESDSQSTCVEADLARQEELLGNYLQFKLRMLTAVWRHGQHAVPDETQEE